MPRYRTAYPPEFRRQMVDLVRSGRTPEELVRSTISASLLCPTKSFKGRGHWRQEYWLLGMAQSSQGT